MEQTFEIEEVFDNVYNTVAAIRLDFKGGRCSLNSAAMELMGFAAGENIAPVKLKGQEGFYLCHTAEDAGIPLRSNKRCGVFNAAKWKNRFFDRYKVDKSKGKSIHCLISTDPLHDEKHDCYYYRVLIS
jgi:hypothetical protein